MSTLHNSIYALKLNNELNESFYQYLLPKTNEDKLAVIQNHLRKEDAYRSVFAEFLARYAIIQSTGLNNKNIVFRYSDYGKPFLAGVNNLHFNISHSGEWVVCAIDKCPVGIDIQHISAIDLDISKNFFSGKEHRDLLLKDATEQLGYFYELWTLKESYMKQIGKGMSIPLDSFAIQIAKDKTVFIELNNQVNKGIYFKQYTIDANYKMAVCALTSFSDEVKLVSMQEIMNFV